MNRLFQRPLIPLAVALILGIVTGEAHPGYGFWGWALGVGAIFFSFSLLFRWKNARLLLLLLLFFLSGSFSIQSWIDPRLPEDHIKTFTSGEHKWLITGTILTPPYTAFGKVRFELMAQTATAGSLLHQVSGKMWVTVSADEFKGEAGDTVSFVGRLRRPRNFGNPGAFDYERHMASKGIRVTANATKGSFRHLSSRDKGGFYAADPVLFRQKIIAQIRELGAGDGAALMGALVVGDRSGISPELRHDFAKLGISHLIAISGLHVGIVGGAVFFLFRWLLSRFRFFLWRAWTRKGAAVPTFLMILAYAMISGMFPSTRRAVIMIAIFLLAVWAEREQDSFNTLAAAALAMALYHPLVIFSLSFQLSFAAVGAILYGFSRRSVSYEQGPRNIRSWIYESLFISCCALLGTLPLASMYFNYIPLISPLSNLIFIPIVGFIAVPVGLTGVFLYPILPDIAVLLMRLDIFYLDMVAELVRICAHPSFLGVGIISMNIFETIIYYLLIFGLVEWFSTDDRTRKRKLAGICIAIGVVAGSADLYYWIDERFLREDLRVTVIDVGQGNAALLELPKGGVMLIDGGGFYDNDIFDVGERIIAPLLWQKKIMTVDKIVLSHPNSDHLNGLLFIAENFSVKEIWTNGEAVDIKGYKELLSIIRERKIPHKTIETLPRTQQFNRLKVDILYPPDDFLSQEDRWRDENNNSLVIRIVFGSVSFLFTGDIEEEAEAELAEIAGKELKSMLLVAPHHGSRTSSTNAFLDAVDPEAVLISAGWNNQFRLPHPSVLDRYQKRGYRIFRTDLQGAVRVKTDGERISIGTNQGVADVTLGPR